MATSESVDNLQLYLDVGAIPLAYARDKDKIFLASSGLNPRWPGGVLRAGSARIDVGMGVELRSARLVTSAERKAEVIALFAEKYGQVKADRWYSGESRIIELIKSDEASADPSAVYRDWLESEFDSIASDYDRHIFGNLVNSLLRERSVTLLKKEFARNSTLLEIGCGTGTETLELLREGHEIVAVDISQKMLDIVKEKARKNGLASNLRLEKLNAENISSLVGGYGLHFFDGIYSTYGAMNCVQDISVISVGAHDLLSLNGKLILGIYNRLCAAEILGYMMKLKLLNAVSRFKRRSLEGESRFCIDIYSYTLGEILSSFANRFRLTHVEGVPVIIPPSNFVGYVEKFRRKFDLIKKMDAWLGTRWPFYGLGDHFLTVMVPNESSPSGHRS